MTPTGPLSSRGKRMASKKQDSNTKKPGPGQPDDDRRVTRTTNVKIGRNASTGQFTPVKTAKQQPKTHVVETIKKPVSPKPTKKK